MPQLYRSPQQREYTVWSLIIGGVCGLLIFLLIPLTQYFQKPEAPAVVIEAISVATPPPPPPLEEPPPPPKTEEAAPPPELRLPPSRPSLEQLELTLNPGVGGDLSFDSQIHLDLSMESVEELSRLFGFDELDEVPRLVRKGRPKLQQSAEFQRVMRRQGKKVVVLEVTLDERGVVTVQKVVSATHEALVPAATQAAESSRFSPPTRGGDAVRARYVWPLSF